MVFNKGFGSGMPAFSSKGECLVGVPSFKKIIKEHQFIIEIALCYDIKPTVGFSGFGINGFLSGAKSPVCGTDFKK